MKAQPVETTIYSLSDAPPAAESDRRDGQRHMTLYRVGSVLVEDRRELCLIKNISAGGMMIRAYCPIPKGTSLSIELKSGQPIEGRVSWPHISSTVTAVPSAIEQKSRTIMPPAEMFLIRHSSRRFSTMIDPTR